MRTEANRFHGHILAGMEFVMGRSSCTKVDDTWQCLELSFPFNRLYIVKSGGALLWSGGKEYMMEPGMAYLLPAGLPCAYRCPNQMEKLYFHFNYFCPDRYDVFWDSGRIGCLPVPEGMTERLTECIAGRRLLDTLAVQQGVLTMITAFMWEQGMGRETIADYSEIVSDTIGYIRENLSAQLRVDRLAERRFVSRTHLREMFRKETGITLGRYIDEQLMLEAQRRLSQTDDPVGVISQDLGFCDQFYFSHRFAKMYGIPPQRYRRNIK